MANQQTIETRATNYVSMESHVHDLACMARIAAAQCSDISVDSDADERALFAFTVYHLEEMILRFRKRYTEKNWSEKDLYPRAAK